MDYKETHISFLYDDLVKEYGNEQGKQLYALCRAATVSANQL